MSVDPRDAFPSDLYDEANNVVCSLPDVDINPLGIIQVDVDGEVLKIPYRVYYSELRASTIEDMPDIEELITHCIYTRHNDGFVRQIHLERLFNADHKWIVPFVLQLVGEYVVEIIEAIYSKLDLLNTSNYSSFADENPEYIELIKSRIVSYWDCYYRSQFPRFVEYPGFVIANKFNWWHSSDIRRLRAR